MQLLTLTPLSVDQVTDTQIQRYSLYASHCLLVVSLLLPVASLWSLWNTGFKEVLVESGITERAVSLAQQWPLTGMRQGLFGLFVLLPDFLISAALLTLRRTFVEFARGAYFGVPVMTGLRNFSLCISAYCFLEIALNPARTAILTWFNGKGQREAVLSISSPHIMLLFMVGCVWIVTWVFGRAIALQEENRQFV
jgi:hypothetical protein